MPTDLTHRLMQGVIPGQPGAMAHLLSNAAALVPWTLLLWFTAFSLLLGIAAGWWRGRIWAGIGLALVVGPIALPGLWVVPPGRRGPARRRLDERARLEALHAVIQRTAHPLPTGHEGRH